MISTDEVDVLAQSIFQQLFPRVSWTDTAEYIKEAYYRMARRVLAEALPYIEVKVREQVAVEIEALGAYAVSAGAVAAYGNAARIARKPRANRTTTQKDDH